MKPRARQSRRPKLGQHFLIDAAIVERIVEVAQLLPDAQVVEIGPGQGILTRALTAAVPQGQLLAIEVDGTLAHQLRERVSKRVKVIHADALRFDYTTIRPARPVPERSASGTGYHVVSNLPYQITSPILHRLIGLADSSPTSLTSEDGHGPTSEVSPAGHAPETMTLMVQREVAERMTAKPHTRERGLLTVVCEWYGTAVRAFDVPPTAFDPPPKIWSSVVRLVRDHLSDSTRGVQSERRPAFEPFVRFLKLGFSQKRRQIHHPFTAAFPRLKPRLDRMLAAAGVERSQRAEELSYAQWVHLYNAMQRALPAR